MSKFNIEEIRDLADKNLASMLLHRNKLAAHAKRIITQDYMIYTIGAESADGHLNGLLCFESRKHETLLDTASNFFKDEKKDFVIWIRDHKDKDFESIIKSRGYAPMREPGIAGMAINTRIEGPTLPEGYTLKKVKSLKSVQDYAKVVREAFDKDEKLLQAMYGHVGMLIGDKLSAFVLYKDEEAVAVSTTFYSDGLAGIYYLATIEGHRGKGIGSYMTSVATNAGFDMGADTVILQASLLGEPIYKRLGYEVITHYRWYKIEV